MRTVAIEVPVKIPSKELSKQILFPGRTSDLTRFPKMHDLHLRFQCKPQDRMSLQCFLSSVIEATKRVWILDPFFGDDCISSIPSEVLDAFHVTEAEQIRFITKNSSHADEYLTSIRDKRKGRIPGENNGVEWINELEKNTIPYAHDRFAITDEELWHFGYTVGGFGPVLSAVSRGWSAIETGAVDFYRNIWRILGGSEW